MFNIMGIVIKPDKYEQSFLEIDNEELSLAQIIQCDELSDELVEGDITATLEALEGRGGMKLFAYAMFGSLGGTLLIKFLTRLKKAKVELENLEKAYDAFDDKDIEKLIEKVKTRMTTKYVKESQRWISDCVAIVKRAIDRPMDVKSEDLVAMQTGDKDLQLMWKKNKKQRGNKQGWKKNAVLGAAKDQLKIIEEVVKMAEGFKSRAKKDLGKDAPTKEARKQIKSNMKTCNALINAIKKRASTLAFNLGRFAP
jgi:hypothetical protein